MPWIGSFLHGSAVVLPTASTINWHLARDSNSIDFRGQLNQLFRKDHCEACKGVCFEQAIKGYVEQYGDDTTKLGDFIENWKSSLQVDHIDGNRYNNDPSNHATICPNVHMLKTQRQKDYLNEYSFGKK